MVHSQIEVAKSFSTQETILRLTLKYFGKRTNSKHQKDENPLSLCSVKINSKWPTSQFCFSLLDFSWIVLFFSGIQVVASCLI